MIENISQLPPWTFTLVGLVFGLMVGSFANVCISRLPQKQSVVFPASHCPKCNKPIHVMDNIPLISYILLKGQCRNCKQKISLIYPAIELVTGLLMAAVFYRFGFSWECLIFAIVVPALVIITVIDIEHQIIPDVITLPGIVFGLAAGSYLNGWLDSVIGLALGGGMFWLLAEGYFRIRGKMGMGGGDIKYIAAAGALMGWAQVLFIISIRSFFSAGYPDFNFFRRSHRRLVPESRVTTTVVTPVRGCYTIYTSIKQEIFLWHSV
jgi:leader peptidase (prepilin peptidase)/N-methyltransferase